MFCVNSRNMYAKCLDGRGWRKSIFASLKLKPVGRVSVVLDRSHSTLPRVVSAQILRELKSRTERVHKSLTERFCIA